MKAIWFRGHLRKKSNCDPFGAPKDAGWWTIWGPLPVAEGGGAHHNEATKPGVFAELHGCHGCYQFYGEKQFYDIPWVCSWFHVISHCLQIKPTRSQVWTLLPGATASPAAHHCVSSRNSYYCHCSDVLRSPRGIEWRPPGGNRGRQEESAPTTGFCLRRSVDWKMFFSGILPPRKRAIKKHRIGFWGIPSFLEAKWVQLLVST